MSKHTTASEHSGAACRTIPGRDQLATIPRDLRFRPSVAALGSVLDRSQVDQFNRNGFLMPFDLLDGDERRDLRLHLERRTADLVTTGGEGAYISSAHLADGKVCELLIRPSIVALVQAILGRDIVGWDAHYFVKGPGERRHIGWHRDAEHWPLTPSRTVSVWLALGDADLDNGCMQFVPGSHLEDAETQLDGCGQFPARAAGAERKARNTVVPAILRAGQASIHSDLLLHGSGPNHSERARPNLTLRYCTPEVRAHFGWSAGGLMVAGDDPTGHWSRPGLVVRTPGQDMNRRPDRHRRSLGAESTNGA